MMKKILAFILIVSMISSSSYVYAEDIVRRSPIMSEKTQESDNTIITENSFIENDSIEKNNTEDSNIENEDIEDNNIGADDIENSNTEKDNVEDKIIVNQVDQYNSEIAPYSIAGNEEYPDDIYAFIKNNMPSGEYIFAQDVVISDGTYTFKSLELLQEQLRRLSDASYQPVWDQSNEVLQSLPVNNMEVFTLLSNTNPDVYRKAEISKADSFVAKPQIADIQYNGEVLFEFKGLGSNTVAFEGQLNMNDLSVARPLFNYVILNSGTIKDNELTIKWDGSEYEAAALANKLSSCTEELTVKFSVSEDNKLGKYTAPLINTLEGSLNLNVNILNKKPFEMNSSEFNNYGSIINDFIGDSLTINLTGSFSKISIYTTKEGSKIGNAGGLIGYSAGNVTFNDSITMPESIIQAEKGSAGGLIGLVYGENKEIIVTADNVDLSNMSIHAIAAGGVIGNATNTKLFVNKNIIIPENIGGTVTNIAGSGDFNSSKSGGIFGWFHLTTYSMNVFDENLNIIINDNTLIAGNVSDGKAGSYIGYLSFESARPVEFENLFFKTKVTAGTSGFAGGLVGYADKQNDSKITVENVDITVDNDTSAPLRSGGLIGYSELVLIVNNVSVIAPNPKTSAKGTYGGVVGLTKKNVKVTNFTLTTYNEAYPYNSGASYSSQNERRIGLGGGVVGCLEKAVLELNGYTDLTNVGFSIEKFDNQYDLGLIVGKNDCGIIYANGDGNGTNDGWVLKRPTYEYRLEDIGNYGEVIRLTGESGKLSDNLLSLSDEGVLAVKEGTVLGIINSADDFALHALAIQTHGQLGLLEVNEELTNQTITITDSIDLSDTGVNSLTRDTKDKITNFTLIQGDNEEEKHTITFNSGAAYGLRRDGKLATGYGNGEHYRHGAYGLIGNISNATIKNLNVDGDLYFGSDFNTDAGILMAKADLIPMEISNVDVSGSINFTGNKVASVGGLTGYTVHKNNNAELNISTVNANVNINYLGFPQINSDHHASNYKTIYDSDIDNITVGGLIGISNGAGLSTVNLTDVTVGGDINAENTRLKKVGGLIALADNTGSNESAINLQNVIVNEKINTNSNSFMGGSLGYFWNKYIVNFNTVEDKFAVTTNSSIISTDNADTAGLVYAATGNWNLGTKAIDASELTIKTGNGEVGLIVNHGEKQKEAGKYVYDGNALYLKFTEDWNKSFLINEDVMEAEPGAYDEIVLYTAVKDGDGIPRIMETGAGVISLRTPDSTNFVSYENRTVYGKDRINYRSRYYYNLDTFSVIGEIDTPEELVLWSVNKYAANNIKGYIANSMPEGNTIKGNIDLTGYSYYPIDIYDTSITVNANINFANESIENATEFSTFADTIDKITQHYAMHAGLIYNYYSDKNLITAKLSGSLTGTIGKVTNGSGAFICGSSRGSAEDKTIVVEIKDLYLDKDDMHLKVNNLSDYGPILINKVQRFSKISVDGLYADEVEDSASSLIGVIGEKIDNEIVEGISVDFKKVVLPDLPNDRFTRATLAESFYFNQSTTGAYNFTKNEDWETQTHIKQVTYGREIGGTKEYNKSLNPEERFYFDSSDYVSPTGQFLNDKEDFSIYLPYVAKSPMTENSLDEGYHELRINLSYPNIDNGCGTYADPFKVDGDDTLKTIAEYISTGVAIAGWKINVVNSLDNPCNNDLHSPYEYDGNNWNNGTSTMTNEKMREYMANAYYLITNDITIENFNGFGTGEYQFKGVVVGQELNIKDGKPVYPTITLTGTSKFITSSYGSVVKNLTLDYSESVNTIIYQPIEKDYTSRSYFGGVFGSVMGGDNIIDNVDVTMGTVNISGDLKYIIPVGSYVGVISGGGVIFRNIPENKSFNAGTIHSYYEIEKDINGNIVSGTHFYVNNYIGRVLEGYAFSEACDLNNTNKNYKINKLNPTTPPSLSFDGTNVSINNAEGLLIYTSILSSGAGSYGLTKPYSLGKARKATYDFVGVYMNDENLESFTKDWSQSKLDDSVVSDSNLPYLNENYGNGMVRVGGKIISYTLTKNTYDMSVYGNAYRGIGPRYLSNASINTGTEKDIVLDNINPIVSAFNGNNAKIIADSFEINYVGDDHFAVAVGGLFNTLNPATDAIISKVAVSKSNLGIEYYTYKSDFKLTNDTWTNFSYILRTSQWKNLKVRQGRFNIGVGGIVGNLPTNPTKYCLDSTGSKRNANKVKFVKVSVEQNTKIISPFAAGGFIGNSGFRFNQKEDFDNWSIGLLLGGYTDQYVFYGFEFEDSIFSDIIVYGGNFTGGYVGFLGNGGHTTESSNHPGVLFGSETKEYGLTILNRTGSQLTIGSDSDIYSRRMKTDNGIDGDNMITSTVYIGGNANGKISLLPGAGGVVGYAGLPISMGIEGQLFRFYNVSVKSGRSAGGVAAWAAQTVDINGLTLEGIVDENGRSITKIGDLFPDKVLSSNLSTTNKKDYSAEFAGGIVGYKETGDKPINVSNLIIKNMNIFGGKISNYPSYAGGIAGHFFSKSKISGIYRNLEFYNNIITASTPDGIDEKNTNGYAGLIYGSSKGYDHDFYVENVLIKNNEIECNSPENKGLINGYSTGGAEKVYGLSIINTPDQNDKLKSLPADLMGTSSTKTNIYATYTDYFGNAIDNKGEVTALIHDQKQKYPYVITSPIGNEITLEGQKVRLYGDASNPQTVLDIATRPDKKKVCNYYRYNIPDPFVLKQSNVSTYLTEMNRAGEEEFQDFPVLTIPVADTSATTETIIQYLDVATNGAFSDIYVKNKGAIDVTITSYQEEKGGDFLARTGLNSLTKPLDYNKNLNQFYTNYAWDSGRNTFELLTVTFSETIKDSNNVSQTFKHELNIPIVVRRVMEVDFSATFKQGAVYTDSLFEGVKDPLTVGFNEYATGLIKYTYNTEENYGFKSLAENGAKLGPVEKTLIFTNPNSAFKSLPNGTQFVLLDRQNEDKAYKYILTDQNGDDATEISLTNFVDSEGKNYQNKWISEIFNFTVQGSTEGMWYETDEANALLKIDGKYYRLKTSNDEDTSKICSITFDETKQTEQFYLVMFIPNSSLEEIENHNGINQKNDLNGYILTMLAFGDSVTYNINHKLLDGVTTDVKNQTPSTYSFYSGYSQNITDLSNENVYDIYKVYTGGVGNPIKIHIVDEIHVSEGQAFSESIGMYYKLNVSLPYFSKINNDVVLTASNGFPTGCSSENINFYVYTSDGNTKNYYVYNGTTWVPSANRAPALAPFDWNANGSNMELILGTNGTNPVSLTDIRTEILKSENSSLNHNIYVETEMDINMPTNVAELVIAGATGENQAYTKLQYTGIISGTEDGFGNSNYKENQFGTIRYYQSIAGFAELSLSANDPTQLGINCNDLTQADGDIYLTAKLDLSKMSTYEKILNKAQYITFNLSLEQRQDSGNYSEVDINDYLVSKMNYQETNSLTISKNEDETWDLLEGKEFVLPIKVEVNTNIEGANHFSSNYNIILSADIKDADGAVMDVLKINKDYVKYTITRIDVNGIWDPVVN